MGYARLVVPGQTLLITRRTVARHFLFRPDRAMNRAFRFCLAVAASEYDVVVHAACLMSTHLHLVVTDVRGVHPLFTRRLHRLLANFTKVHRGWGGSVFNSGRPSVVRLLTEGAVVDKIGYVLANAVAAGAVRFANEWPGVCSSVAQMGAVPALITRPDRYFGDRRGKLPANAELGFHLPSELVEQHGDDGARRLLSESAEEHEDRARAEVKAKGWRFLGRERVLKTSPYKRAKAYEVFGDRDPTFATLGGGKEAFFEAVVQLRRFRAAYDDALDAWRGGDRAVVFPYGTWLMRVLHGAPCAQSG